MVARIALKFNEVFKVYELWLLAVISPNKSGQKIPLLVKGFLQVEIALAIPVVLFLVWSRSCHTRSGFYLVC